MKEPWYLHGPSDDPEPDPAERPEPELDEPVATLGDDEAAEAYRGERGMEQDRRMP